MKKIVPSSQIPIPVWYLPLWRNFVDDCLSAGVLKVEEGKEHSLYHPEIRGPNMPWIDPRKETAT